MANDVKIIWDEDLNEGDIFFAGGDLTREEGLQTAVMMSLYSDRRADNDDILPDPNNMDKRGWWGDQISEYENDKIGSKLWLLERAKATENNLSLARIYMEECLDWMLEDEVVQDIEVETESQKRQDGTATLAAKITIYQSDGQVIALKFDDLWQAQIEEA
jgi:phage gp46-like protein